jgi:hypothetical protein
VVVEVEDKQCKVDHLMLVEVELEDIELLVMDLLH